MRALVIVMLLSGCMDTVSLVDSDNARLSVNGTKVEVAVRGEHDSCVLLPELLHGAVNGRRMTVVSHGDQETHSGGHLDLGDDDGDGSSLEWQEGQSYTICSNAELAMPTAIERERPDDVVIEIADGTATFVATYPALFTPTTLALASTEIVDGHLVVSWTASPSGRLGQSSVYHYADDRDVYGTSAYYFDLSTELDTVTVTFPEPSKIQRDGRYVLRVGSTVVSTQCDGFEECIGTWRNDPIDLDPALLDMALDL